MPPMCRVGDICSGHGCWPPRSIITGSVNVLVGGLPAARMGDSVAPHCKPCGKKSQCHSGVIAKGSTRVFVNGIPAARIGDPIVSTNPKIPCSSICATAWPTVLGGG